MEVFRIDFDKCTTMANTVKGFEKSGVFPWNPAIINDKNLPRRPCLEIKSQLPDVNTSINEGSPETSEKPKEDTGTENVTDSCGGTCRRSQIKRTHGYGCDHTPRQLTQV